MWIIIYAVLIFLVISFGAGLSLIPASERKRMTLGQYIERVIVPGNFIFRDTFNSGMGDGESQGNGRG
mgnify:CR=1 FL=1